MLRAWVCLNVLAATMMSAAVAAPSAGTGPVCAGGVAVASMDVDVAGRERVVRSVPVRPNTHLLLSAVESNIDVVLGIPVAKLAADSPVPRWGPQRIAFDTGRATSVELELIGKEHAGARGRVHVSIVAYDDRAYAGACVQAERQLASGDAHYAVPQRVALGLERAESAAIREHYEAAIRDYQRAAESVDAQATPPGSGLDALAAQAHLLASGAVYQAIALLANVGDSAVTWALASDEATRAERAFRQMRDEYGVARARAARATADMERALSASSGGTASAAPLLAEARATLEEVAAFHTRRNELFDSALALNNIGLAFYYESRYAEAIRAYRRAQPVYAQLGEKTREAQVLQNIAVTQHELGRFSEALETFAKVQALLDERDDPQLYADVLNNRALAEYGSRDLDAALRDYSAALEILTRLESTRQQARTLHGIGAVYYASGDLEQAEQYFSRALALRPANIDARGRIVTLRSCANVLSDLGRFADALKLRNEALALAEVSKPMRARVRVQAARDLEALGRHQEAFEMIGLALTEASGDDPAKWQALIERGRLNLAAGKRELAAADAREALRLLGANESPIDQFDALLLAARVAQARGVLRDALAMVERAIALAEQVRIQSANPELRAGLWRSVREAFDLKIDLLVAAADSEVRARDAVARATLETAEQARGRALADYERLSETAAASPERRAGEQRRNELYRQIAARRFRLDGYLDRGLATDPHIAAIRADIGALEREVDLVNAGLAKRATVKGGARDTTTHVGAARDGIAPGVDALIRAMPPDSAVIGFWLGAKSARAWTIAPSGVQLIELGDTARIDAAALALYNALNDFTAVSSEERLKRLQALYRLIIEPLPEPIRKSRVLTFIPDGKLHYVPFAALATGATSHPEFLLDHHDVAIAPSLSVLQRDTPSIARSFPKEMLLVADPVYSSNDPRLAGSGRIETAGARPVPRVLPITLRGRTLERLDGAAREAEAITQLIGREHIVALNGFDATRDAFLAQDLAQYRYIHIAAHGSADARSPKFSGLVLSSVNSSGAAVPGQVFAGDLALRRMDADVVVLSACETALGPEAAGEGLLGLRYAAHAGGARSVVASLWQAPDVSAAQIMTEFYRRMTRERETPRASLAGAMRSARAQYADPFLWGAFEISLATSLR